MAGLEVLPVVQLEVAPRTVEGRDGAVDSHGDIGDITPRAELSGGRRWRTAAVDEDRIGGRLRERRSFALSDSIGDGKGQSTTTLENSRGRRIDA